MGDSTVLTENYIEFSRDADSALVGLRVEKDQVIKRIARILSESAKTAWVIDCHIMTGKAVKLSPRQRQGITHLLSERDIATAALKTNVSERTMYRWLELPAFRAALASAEGQVIDVATRRLLTVQDPAISVLTWATADKNNPAGERLRAAQVILDYLLKLRELRNVEGRIAKLEEAIYGQPK